ncbi:MULTISPECIES: hypothetical protein [Burkholderia]|uniref:hypothetical protein n=1 Tax=Burkholderia TaxID=32008 RepID=UPI000B7AC678|nr:MULTISPECIES: hypothetical protein [Burkholderia]OXI95991.1 hypothetical protein CFB41_23010 [Burkholderia sp. AU33803]PRD90473.1 hypothetical protein C6P88_21795 [Burkholderia contaminans]
MESEKVIVWKDDPATQVEVATFVNQSTAAFVVDVTEPQQVKEWTKLLESTTADDHAQGDAALLPWPRRVPNAAIYGGVVATTVSTFALLTGFAIWRRYTVDAELSQNRMRFRLRPPPQQA